MTAAYAQASGASKQTAPVIFTINDDGSYSFQGKSIDEATLKARLMVIAMLAPQPTVHVVVHGNGNNATAQETLQQFKTDAANVGIAHVVVNH